MDNSISINDGDMPGMVSEIGRLDSEPSVPGAAELPDVPFLAHSAHAGRVMFTVPPAQLSHFRVLPGHASLSLESLL